MPSSAGPSPEQQKEINDAIQDNLDKVASFSQREQERASLLQRFIEKISRILGHPIYFIAFILFCAAWISLDLVVKHVGYFYFDEPPFAWLQGIIAFNGVLITMAVLIRQNRMTRIEEKRSHLELQVNLLAEQKTTKIIQLLEELRRDLPNVKNRHDPHAKILQETTNPDAVLQALESQQLNEN